MWLSAAPRHAIGPPPISSVSRTMIEARVASPAYFRLGAPFPPWRVSRMAERWRRYERGSRV